MPPTVLASTLRSSGIQGIPTWVPKQLRSCPYSKPLPTTRFATVYFYFMQHGASIKLGREAENIPRLSISHSGIRVIHIAHQRCFALLLATDSYT